MSEHLFVFPKFRATFIEDESTYTSVERLSWRWCQGFILWTLTTFCPHHLCFSSK